MKRLFDFILALASLIIVGPILLITSIFIKFDSEGPVFFTQRRVGKNDREFYMYKFRSMVVGTPNVATDKLTNSNSYITKVGYYIRKYSIDELPQLLNIIKGDMSFVGPRPALYNQYDLRQMRNEAGISRIKPGLTGWAQINGRDEISLKEKVDLDLYYFKKQSFLLDLRIIIMTAFSVSAGNGVNVKVKI